MHESGSCQWHWSPGSPRRHIGARNIHECVGVLRRRLSLLSNRPNPGAEALTLFLPRPLLENLQALRVPCELLACYHSKASMLLTVVGLDAGPGALALLVTPSSARFSHHPLEHLRPWARCSRCRRIGPLYPVRNYPQSMAGQSSLTAHLLLAGRRSGGGAGSSGAGPGRRDDGGSGCRRCRRRRGGAGNHGGL